MEEEEAEIKCLDQVVTLLSQQQHSSADISWVTVDVGYMKAEIVAADKDEKKREIVLDY